MISCYFRPLSWWQCVATAIGIQCGHQYFSVGYQIVAGANVYFKVKEGDFFHPRTLFCFHNEPRCRLHSRGPCYEAYSQNTDPLNKKIQSSAPLQNLTLKQRVGAPFLLEAVCVCVYVSPHLH